MKLSKLETEEFVRRVLIGLKPVSSIKYPNSTFYINNTNEVIAEKRIKDGKDYYYIPFYEKTNFITKYFNVFILIWALLGFISFWVFWFGSMSFGYTMPQSLLIALCITLIHYSIAEILARMLGEDGLIFYRNDTPDDSINRFL